MTHFTINQTFTSNGQLFCPNQLTWTVSSPERSSVLWRKLSLLWMIWYRLQKVPKKEHHTVFEKFSVPWFILQKSKLFLLVADYSLRIHSYELRLLYKSGPFLRENYLYLEQSAIGRKKFQKVQPESFLKTIQFHDSFYFRRIFTFNGRPFCPNWLIGILFPLETW